ncbi:hypothetical protein B0H63DRAFT_454207 [Podospora didyma]|uniref:C2H2-type domain-containing protein n=1 Tax=Podospora didyma TaxID=330526 RepID=A0AAE0K4M0_9PEZI|nr:hypothetical protein B0H63DRAFT_454207 [Podospora didyma]
MERAKQDGQARLLVINEHIRRVIRHFFEEFSELVVLDEHSGGFIYCIIEELFECSVMAQTSQSGSLSSIAKGSDVGFMSTKPSLQAQLDFDPKHYLRLRSVIYPGQTPSLDSLAFLKEYFYSTMFRQQLETLPQRPRTPRQNSWDSTTSTLCELEAPNVFLLGHAPKIAQDPLDGIDLPPVAVPPIDLPAFDFPPREALVPLPLDLAGVQQARDHKPTGGLRRSPPFSMSCELCQFYPARGTDQRKKMAKHLLTNKHRVAAGHEWDSGDMFQCRLRSRDGSVCLREFNRRDNFRQHCKKVHGSSSEASEVGDGQSARPWDGLPELPGNGVQRVSSTHHPHPKRRRTILGRAPPLR